MRVTDWLIGASFKINPCSFIKCITKLSSCSRQNKMQIMLNLGTLLWRGFRQCETRASSGCWKKIHTQDKGMRCCGGFRSGSSGCQLLQMSCGRQDKRNGFPQISELHCDAAGGLSSWKPFHIRTERPRHPNGCFCGPSGMMGCWRYLHMFHKHNLLLHRERFSCALSNQPAL